MFSFGILLLTRRCPKTLSSARPTRYSIATIQKTGTHQSTFLWTNPILWTTLSKEWKYVNEFQFLQAITYKFCILQPSDSYHFLTNRFTLLLGIGVLALIVSALAVICFLKSRAHGQPSKHSDKRTNRRSSGSKELPKKAIPGGGKIQNKVLHDIPLPAAPVNKITPALKKIEREKWTRTKTRKKIPHKTVPFT